ncbi:MAG: hypothetical protein QM531_01350 [Candidatus Pacebacteria bacterium]|nr:hypothetical protein [Candidatus Paceibacterota bacterium]
MSPDLKREVWAEMRAVGDRLQGVLQSDVRHPRGRNPYAHVAGCVKERFGCSYGDLPDERVGEVRRYLIELEAEEKSLSGKGGRD